MRLLTPDPFLAEILGKPAYRVDAPSFVAQSITPSGQDAFAYAKTSPSDLEVIAQLEANGFRLADTNVQLDRPINSDWPDRDLGPGYSIRPADSEDRIEVQMVARESFVYTRFHLDPQIPNHQAAEIKATWAGNFFSGKRGDHMLVVNDAEEKVLGFLQLLNRERELIIDLIAVAPSHQGMGLATALIRTAAEVCQPRCDRFLVGTQIANTKSIRAYEKLGFRVCGASYLFHYHGPLSANQKTY